MAAGLVDPSILDDTCPSALGAAADVLIETAIGCLDEGTDSQPLVDGVDER